MRVYSLSFHAEYACRHSGACCTSRWPIPVERRTFEQLSERIAGGRLILPDAGHGADDGVRCAKCDRSRPDPEGVHDPRGAKPFTAIAGAPPDTPVVATVCADGACVFYERDSGLCAIHRQAGPSLLPVACRQFPRISLLDARGLFVTLSHYCPTAADLLFRDDTALRIVAAPAAFPPDFDYDPLDARDAFPPLLRPDVVLDLETFGRWEREAVARLARDERTPEEALAALETFTELVRSWTPDQGELARHFDQVVRHGQAVDRANGHRRKTDEAAIREHRELALAAVPDAVRPDVAMGDFDAAAFRRWVEPRWGRFGLPIRRYLAARLFGSWLAYQGRGLRTIVFSLQVALSLLKAIATCECARRGESLGREALVCAIRRTDEILLHLASRERLARTLSRVEARRSEHAGGCP